MITSTLQKTEEVKEVTKNQLNNKINIKQPEKIALG